MLKNFQKVALAAAVVTVIAGCNNGSNNPTPAPTPTPTPAPTPAPTDTVRGKASLGALKDATCSATPAANTSQTTGTPATSAADGTFAITNIPRSPSPFPVVVTCVGGTYFNEQSATFVANGSQIKTTVTAPATTTAKAAADGTTALNILTTLAADILLKLPAEQRTPAAAAAANQKIQDAFCPGIDITNPPATVDSANSQLGTDPASQLAVVLASLTFAANAGGVSLDTFLTSLRNDADDGQIDGRAGGAPVQGYTSFNGLVTQLRDGVTQYGNENPNASNAAQATTQTTDNNPRSDGNTTPPTSGS